MGLTNLFKNGWGLKSADCENSSPYKDLVVMGSSSTELFDYIFGDNPQYHPFGRVVGMRALQTANHISAIQQRF